jgi:hypothetical protein
VAKRRASDKTTPADMVRFLEPALHPLIEPVVAPVLRRLDTHEEILLELKAALDIQFKRTAEIQAQLDRLLARLSEEAD